VQWRKDGGATFRRSIVQRRKDGGAALRRRPGEDVAAASGCLGCRGALTTSVDGEPPNASQCGVALVRRDPISRWGCLGRRTLCTTASRCSSPAALAFVASHGRVPLQLLEVRRLFIAAARRKVVVGFFVAAVVERSQVRARPARICCLRLCRAKSGLAHDYLHP